MSQTFVFNPFTNTFDYVSISDGSSPVTSVNGQNGAVTLTTDNIAEGSNLYYTAIRARSSLSVEGGADPLAYNSSSGIFSLPKATTSQSGYLSAADWTSFSEKMYFRGAYDGNIQYFTNDVVNYLNSSYICLFENHGGPPPTHPELWSLVSTGIESVGTGLSYTTDGVLSITELLNFRGVWDTSTEYETNDVVNYFGSSYICLFENHSGSPYNNPGLWSPMSIGIGSVGTGLSYDSSNGLISVSFPTGTVNTFTAYDASGNLESLPGWQVNPTTGGAIVTLTQAVSTDNYSQNVESYYADVNPSIDTTGVNYTGDNFEFHYGRAGSNNNFGGNLQNINLYSTVEGSGTVNNLYSLLSEINFGDSTAAGHMTTGGGFSLLANITNAYTLNQYIGFQHNFTMDSGATLTQDFTHISLNTNAIVGRNFDHIYSYSSANVAAQSRGIVFDINGTTGNDLTVFSGQVTGNVGGNFQGLQINMSGTAASASCMELSNQSAIAGTLNGVVFNNQVGGAANNFYAFFSGNDANITNSSKGMDVRVDGNATDKTMFSFYSTSGSVSTWTGGNITAAGSSSGQVIGLNIDISGITSSQQKQGINVNDGSVNFSSVYDTGVLPASPGFITLNSMGGEFHIAAGSPVSNTLAFGNSLGIQIFCEDNMGPDPFGGFIGFSENAYASQCAVATTKTVDTINFCLSGAQIPDISGSGVTDGGTVTNMALYRGIGLLPAGGNIVVTNMYGLRIDPLLSIFALNSWGVSVEDTNANNYFAKNVVIGGSTKLPTGVYALDVTGDAIVSGLIQAASVIPADGATGTFTTADSKTVTVTSGIITSIV